MSTRVMRHKVELVVGVEIRAPAFLVLEEDSAAAIAEALERLEIELRTAGFETTTAPEVVSASAREVATYALPVGARPSPCRGCGQHVWWGRTERETPVPLNRDGTIHLADCRAAAAV